MARARLDLDKAEYILVPRDKIEFATMMRRTIVPRNDDATSTAPVEVSFFFPQTSDSEVFS